MEYYNGTRKLLSFILYDWKLILFLTCIFGIYFYFTSTFTFFEKKGIKFMQPKIFFGNLETRFFGKKSFHAVQYDIYNQFKGYPCGGTFEGRRPILHIIDHELIKAITIRDFDHFMDRNSLNSNEPRYLKQSLLNLKGSEWKGVRSTLTPTFSSVRLRNMLPLLQLCSDQLVTYLKQYVNTDVEMKDIMGNFTLDVIGACAFGIKCEALTNENSHFVKVAKMFNFMTKIKRFCIFFILMFMPNVMKYLNISFLNSESIEELVRILKKAKAERRSSGIKKNDFLQILIDAADSEKSDDNSKLKYLDDDTIDAQSLLFLIAGYETSSTLLSFAIHTLATTPELQDKLRAHVEEVTKGKEVTYEVLSQLSYLEGFLLGTSIQINVGDVLAIPIYGIHMDPDIYPDPEIIRPERFIGDQKRERPSHLFLAFGAGPRNCIGIRFAMYSTKMAMVSLLKNFKFSVCAKTDIPIKIDKRTLFLKAESGLWVRLETI